MMIKLFPWRSLGVTWFEFAKSTVNENDPLISYLF
jgi:hypothetical protein